MSSIACRTLVFVSLFLCAAVSLAAATPKAPRPVYLESGFATFEGSLEAGGIRFEAATERGRFQATLRPTFNGVAVAAGLVGATDFSLWISATPDDVRSAAVFGDLGSIELLHEADGIVTIGDTIDDCERLLAEPSLIALQQVNAELAAAGEVLEEHDLWLAFLLRQLELSVGSIASCGDAIVQPASGQCSIQLTFVGCRLCCDIDERLSQVLVPLCDAAARGSGGLVGGWVGAIAGGLAGDLVCRSLASTNDSVAPATGIAASRTTAIIDAP